MKKTVIKTELLCKSFIIDGEINNIIKNMDLEIYEDDFTVIMGSSGSGKSTLLYSLSGMDKVTTGKVFFDGEDITNMKEKQLSKIISESGENNPEKMADRILNECRYFNGGENSDDMTVLVAGVWKIKNLQYKK